MNDITHVHGNHDDHVHENAPPVPVTAQTQETDDIVPPLAPKKAYYIDPDERIPSKHTGQTAEEIMDANNFLGDLT